MYQFRREPYIDRSWKVPEAWLLHWKRTCQHATHTAQSMGYAGAWIGHG